MTIIILALATWRLASLLVYEEGPFSAFLELRKLAGVIHDAENKVMGDDGSFLGRLLNCFWCTSIWAALIPAMLLAESYWEWFVFVLAASAGAIMIEEKVYG